MDHQVGQIVTFAPLLEKWKYMSDTSLDFVPKELLILRAAKTQSRIFPGRMNPTVEHLGELMFITQGSS